LRNDELFTKILFHKRKNAVEFATALADIAKQYWSSFDHERTVDLKQLLEIFVKINRNFGGKKMYDSAECFLKIVETLETAFVPKTFATLPETCDEDAWNVHTKNGTFLSDVFLGQARRSYKDETTFEHFDGITVSGSHTSVAKGIDEFLNDTDTGISREIMKFPMILPVIFQKSSDKPFVNYDLSLSVCDAQYDLFSILLHSGNHWINLSKGPNWWYLFNDSIARKIDDLNSLIQKDAMLLLYKKVSR
jgi:hypothetical protein